jgi:hypothetical protein
MYYTSVSRYLVTLCWIQFAYHSYVRKIIGLKIFRHHDGSFGSLSSQFACFLKGVWPFFNGLTNCLWFLRCRVLITLTLFICFQQDDHLIFFRCSGTCQNWYFSFLVGIMGYPNFITLGCSFLSPSFWKSYVIIVSSFISFFHISSRCSF